MVTGGGFSVAIVLLMRCCAYRDELIWAERGQLPCCAVPRAARSGNGPPGATSAPPAALAARPLLGRASHQRPADVSADIGGGAAQRAVRVQPRLGAAGVPARPQVRTQKTYLAAPTCIIVRCEINCCASVESGTAASQRRAVNLSGL